MREWKSMPSSSTWPVLINASWMFLSVLEESVAEEAMTKRARPLLVQICVEIGDSEVIGVTHLFVLVHTR